MAVPLHIQRQELEAQKAQLKAQMRQVRLGLARLDAIEAAGGAAKWRDWGNRFGEGLPVDVLAKIAEKHVAQNEAGWAAWHKKVLGWTEEEIQEEMEERERDGNCLFVFARVCKEWRKAQLKVGGPLCTRVSDVLLPESVALAKWALAEGLSLIHI